jgi:hypothetical protein
VGVKQVISCSSGTEALLIALMAYGVGPEDAILPCLIEMDDTYFGAPKPGKRGRGAHGKAKVVVAMETPEAKPRFAAMRMVPRVSAPEIQALVQERLAAEVWCAPMAGNDTASWIVLPAVMNGSFPVLAQSREGASLGTYFDR